MEKVLSFLKKDKIQLALVVIFAVILFIVGVLLRMDTSGPMEQQQKEVTEPETQNVAIEDIGEEPESEERIESNEGPLGDIDETKQMTNTAGRSSQEPTIESEAEEVAAPELSTGGDRLLTQLEIQSILSALNTERAAVGVNPLTWSQAVAASAETWADVLKGKGCILEHDFNTPYGENIYFEWTDVPGLNDVSTADRVVQWWNAEKNDYSYTTNTCAPGKVCTHYTQNIWKSTTEVGCAKRTCQLSGKSQEVWVCRYNPSGNIAGARPY